MIYNILDYGAVGDGQTNDAPAIQKAIDACHANGGGQVLVPGGKTYYSSSIEIKSNVDLHLEQSAIILASSDIDSYYHPNATAIPKVDVRGDKAVSTPVTLKPSYAFVHAKDADNFSITGQGAIDGNVYAFVHRENQYYCNGDFYPRPTLVYLEHCNHISFTGITLQNSPFWTLHPAGCDDVLIMGIRVSTPLDCTNSDGIDPDHSSNVRIIGCSVSCADDCICLKTTAGNSEYGPTRNVVISGCTLTSTSAAIKLGTEGVGDFENIIVDNCIITDSNRGLSIQIRDGGSVRNVSFSNITIETRRFAECWWGCAEPIVITAHDRNDDTVCGTVENVRFFNISCRGENGVFLAGTPDKHLRDILFENVSVEVRATSKWERGMYDLRPGNPEFGVFKHKSPAMYLMHSDDITVRNSRFFFSGDKRDDFAQGILSHDCENLELSNVKAVAATDAYEAVDVE